MSGEKLVIHLLSLMSLLIDNRLQSKLGTRRIELRVRSFNSTTEPIPTTFDNEPFAISTVRLFGHEIYVSKIVVSPIIWSDAPPKSMIQGFLYFLPIVKALKTLHLWVKVPKPMTWLEDEPVCDYADRRGDNSLCDFQSTGFLWIF